MPAVSLAMTTPVTTVEAQASVEACARMLDAEGLRHVVVVDHAGAVIGTVGDADVWACGRFVGGQFVTTSPDSAGLVAQELLVPPTLIEPDTGLAVALDRLCAHPDRVVVITDPQHRPVGVLTDRDALRFAASFLPTKLTAKGGATEHVVTVAPSDEAGAALHTCRENGFRHLVVVKEAVVVGILSVRDLIRADAQGYPHQKVHSLATKTPLCAPPDLPLREAAMHMHEQRISALPLVAEGRLVGIVTSTDIASILGKMLAKVS
ncbi:MAG: CBS domain-containing membrane protein [Myxococcota bacterium]|jgi:CBS domain-containing membrane protein